jgi:hypothetical protein
MDERLGRASTDERRVLKWRQKKKRGRGKACSGFMWISTGTNGRP